MNLVFQFVQKMTVKNAGIPLFGCDDDDIGLTEAGDLTFDGRDDFGFRISLLEYFPQLLAVLGVRSEDKN